MTFADIASGTSVFIDANTFVYACAPDPQFGPPSLQLLERIEQNICRVSRPRTFWAMSPIAWCHWKHVPSWAGPTRESRKDCKNILPRRQLSRYREAINDILAMGVQFVPIAGRHIASAASMSQQYGLLSGDALTVALMLENGFTNLASNDADFDPVSAVTRFGPL
jgi:predicted nucleic acid-binding protein